MKPEDYKDRMVGSNKLALKDFVLEAFIPSEDNFPVFTMARVPTGDYISLYQAYMECYEDTTEMQFVDKYFHGRLDLWKKIKTSKAFKEEYKEWAEEAGLRRLSHGLYLMTKVATSSSKGAATAIKYLCDHAIVEKSKRKAGRPSQNELEAAKKQLLAEDSEVQGALERLGATYAN